MVPVSLPEAAVDEVAPVLAELENAGFTFHIQAGGMLEVVSPAECTLTDTQRSYIRAHRFEILTYLEKRVRLHDSAGLENECRSPAATCDPQRSLQEQQYKEKWRQELAKCAPPPDWTEEDEAAHQAYWR